MILPFPPVTEGCSEGLDRYIYKTLYTDAEPETVVVHQRLALPKPKASHLLKGDFGRLVSCAVTAEIIPETG